MTFGRALAGPLRAGRLWRPSVATQPAPKTLLHFIRNPQLLHRHLGVDLAAILFIVALSLGNDRPIDSGSHSEQPPTVLETLVYGLEFKDLAVLGGPAVELVLVVDLEVFELVQKKVRKNDPLHDPALGA